MAIMPVRLLEALSHWPGEQVATRVSGESQEIQTCSIFGETFSVSSRSRRCLHNVRAQAMFWSPESPWRLISLCPISLAWRLGGDSSLRWLRRHLRDVSWRLAGSLGSRGKFKHVQFFFFFFFFFLGGETFLVSSRSRRRLRDVRAQAIFGLQSRPSCRNS